jgi:hypothetical protein
MVWVNPPNRFNYTVIGGVRNLRRYASPKCSTAKLIALLRTNVLRAFTLGKQSIACADFYSAVATEDVRLYTLFLLLEP